MRRLSDFRVALIANSILLLGAFPTARGEDFEVHEWSIWFADSLAKDVNDRDRCLSALPLQTRSARRTSLDNGKDGPRPVAMMTFYGPPTDDFEVEILFGSRAADTNVPGTDVVMGEPLDPRSAEWRERGRDALQAKLREAGLRLTRMGLVVVTDVNPHLRETIAQLIAQLGNPVYAERVAAEERLKQRGKPAVPALRKALSEKDLEIVMRCERVLMALGEAVD